MMKNYIEKMKNTVISTNEIAHCWKCKRAIFYPSDEEIIKYKTMGGKTKTEYLCLECQQRMLDE